MKRRGKTFTSENAEEKNGPRGQQEAGTRSRVTRDALAQAVSRRYMIRYDSMVRRSLGLAVALNLLLLVPLPLAACAIASGLDGPCQCPMTNCGPMMATGAGDGGPVISCLCIRAAAPLPAAAQVAGNPPPALGAVNRARALPIAPSFPAACVAIRNPQYSPPALYTLYASLLI